ncbi:DUF4214 domain-containing protein [Mesorhizobium sp. CAU 1741]|uniref:DUF4214 domain-containing protein n=1 Tax=Mesorhizobium sp. CAU 1741 TaxID=3140366 RepID=UPI00325BB3EF
MASIQGIYVALFGRPADPLGLAFYNEATNEGADLTAIGDLAATAEYEARFDDMSSAQIINSLYISLFNRPAEAAGLAFFANALNSGELTINNIAIAILDGAQGADLDVVNAKIAAADLFTAALDTDTEIALYTGEEAAQAGRDFLTPVVSEATIPTAEAIDDAIENLQNVQFPGNPDVVLVAGADSITVNLDSANAGVDESTPYDDTITAAVGTWETGDEIDGGDGVDTFNATVDGTALVLTEDSLVSVEIVNVSVDGGAQALNFEDVSGVEQLWHAGALAATDDLTVTEIAEGITVGVRGDVNGATSSFTFDNADEATLALEDVANGDVVVNDTDVVNVMVDGDSAADLSTDGESIVMTGEGDFNGSIIAAGDFSFDASGLDGVLTASFAGVGAAADEVTVTGTSSVDSITLGSAANTTVVYTTEEKSIYATVETLLAFDVGTDAIDVSAFGLTTEDFVVFGALVDGSAYTDASIGLYDNGAGDTYVFIDSNNNGTLDLASDTAILLDTVAIGALTDANFVFSA